VEPKSVKKTVKLSVSFYAFGIYMRKSYMWNVDEIEPRLSFHIYEFVSTVTVPTEFDPN
jgi:hypothetical protein